ncbi:hypothetical protein JKP88DRAFT_326489 [Tribonema minus]|uniref:Uncharacterized protein n=1 Tax=Tribonema minus TaxID=303371 RepID=A0A835YSY8_9STRA|nr:hypothetical protein JKP88DRAFT_326489 [Tribonema minus]
MASSRSRLLLLVAEPLAPLYTGSPQSADDLAGALLQQLRDILAAYDAAMASARYDNVGTVFPHPFQEVQISSGRWWPAYQARTLLTNPLRSICKGASTSRSKGTKRPSTTTSIPDTHSNGANNCRSSSTASSATTSTGNARTSSSRRRSMFALPPATRRTSVAGDLKNDTKKRQSGGTAAEPGGARKGRERGQQAGTKGLTGTRADAAALAQSASSSQPTPGAAAADAAAAETAPRAQRGARAAAGRAAGAASSEQDSAAAAAAVVACAAHYVHALAVEAAPDAIIDVLWLTGGGAAGARAQPEPPPHGGGLESALGRSIEAPGMLQLYGALRSLSLKCPAATFMIVGRHAAFDNNNPKRAHAQAAPLMLLRAARAVEALQFIPSVDVLRLPHLLADAPPLTLRAIQPPAQALMGGWDPLHALVVEVAGGEEGGGAGGARRQLMVWRCCCGGGGARQWSAHWLRDAHGMSPSTLGALLGLESPSLQGASSSTQASTPPAPVKTEGRKGAREVQPSAVTAKLPTLDMAAARALLALPLLSMDAVAGLVKEETAAAAAGAVMVSPQQPAGGSALKRTRSMRVVLPPPPVEDATDVVSAAAHVGPVDGRVGTVRQPWSLRDSAGGVSAHAIAAGSVHAGHCRPLLVTSGVRHELRRSDAAERACSSVADGCRLRGMRVCKSNSCAPHTCSPSRAPLTHHMHAPCREQQQRQGKRRRGGEAQHATLHATSTVDPGVQQNKRPLRATPKRNGGGCAPQATGPPDSEVTPMGKSGALQDAAPALIDLGSGLFVELPAAAAAAVASAAAAPRTSGKKRQRAAPASADARAKALADSLLGTAAAAGTSPAGNFNTASASAAMAQTGIDLGERRYDSLARQVYGAATAYACGQGVCGDGGGSGGGGSGGGGSGGGGSGGGSGLDCAPAVWPEKALLLTDEAARLPAGVRRTKLERRQSNAAAALLAADDMHRTKLKARWHAADSTRGAPADMQPATADPGGTCPPPPVRKRRHTVTAAPSAAAAHTATASSLPASVGGADLRRSGSMSRLQRSGSLLAAAQRGSLLESTQRGSFLESALPRLQRAASADMCAAAAAPPALLPPLRAPEAAREGAPLGSAAAVGRKLFKRSDSLPAGGAGTGAGAAAPAAGVLQRAQSGRGGGGNGNGGSRAGSGKNGRVQAQLRQPVLAGASQLPTAPWRRQAALASGHSGVPVGGGDGGQSGSGAAVAVCCDSGDTGVHGVSASVPSDAIASAAAPSAAAPQTANVAQLKSQLQAMIAQQLELQPDHPNVAAHLAQMFASSAQAPG